MKLVEQELWQREEKGLIGILPVRDAAEAAAVGPMLSQGDFFLLSLLIRMSAQVYLMALMRGNLLSDFL